MREGLTSQKSLYRSVTLKYMDQSVNHHPLEGLTQAARERNRPIVGRIRRILPRFWNWNHRGLPPRWGDVPGRPNVMQTPNTADSLDLTIEFFSSDMSRG
ncbi:hypothetical protein PoB_001395400 [Plakobranchus ocellatus]|uniref:Uncharacterized protein n=1 Tax=Plakobranchus ocellatus TaxID=259542 RepID=A0AAV3YWL1_9GAST|nr:hypothetical protein PoB_001395400 [Plakobranchus ocellatus]